MANYVKFRRGTFEAFKAFPKDQLEADTLYFIYDKDASTADLYLGSKLISSGANDESIGATELAKLHDVIINAGLASKDLLVYDSTAGTNGAWVNKPLSEAISIMIGANSTSSGQPGLVPAPEAGEANRYLRSDGKWVAIVSNVFEFENTEKVDHIDLINANTNNEILAIGDIAVVKEIIAENNYQHSAYTYDGEKWIAMDGNYNAENVYLANNLTITADIGVQKLNGEGFKVLQTAGKNLKQVLDMILAARALPTYTSPSVSVTPTGLKEYEVGTAVDVTYSATFNDGKYSYEPGENTGVAVSSWKASFNGEELATASGTFTVTVGDDFNKRVTVTATYGAGAAPADNLGNIVIDVEELKTCQIPAGSKSGYTGYVKSYRNIFYGSFVDPIAITGANIRNLNTTKAVVGSFDMDIVEGATQVIIAVPAKHTVPTVADENAFGTNIAEKFNDSIVSVAGASDGYDTNYTVYVYSPSAALGSNTYTVSVV